MTEADVLIKPISDARTNTGPLVNAVLNKSSEPRGGKIVLVPDVDHTVDGMLQTWAKA
jgi:hypothetical protein